MNGFKEIKNKFILVLCLIMVVTLSPINVSAEQNNSAAVNSSISKNYNEETKLNQLPEIKESNSKVESKLDSKLLSLTGKENIDGGKINKDLKAEMKATNQFTPSGALIKEIGTVAPSDMVYVYIETKTAEGDKAIEPYAYKIASRDMKDKLLSAWIDVNKLQQLESLDEVVKVETVTKPRVNVDSEGDNLHKANLVRGLSNGSNGSGIKVGVISDGVDHYLDSVAKGALTQVNVLSNNVGGDEGTAMLEIVHALAPGATLYFHDCGSSTIEFNQAVDALAAAGCNVIVDDISWITEPFFEDGIVANHVRDVINNTGVIYVSAAGNSGASHFIGQYHNDGSNNNDFSAGNSSSTPNKYIYLSMAPGDEAELVLQWDDPFNASTNDYDLYLRDANGNVLASSTDRQTGNGSDPLEVIDYVNTTGSTITARVDVNNYQGKAAAKTLDLYVYGNNYANNIVSSSSIFGQAAVPEVITAGAIEVSNPNQIANFSSQGPVIHLNGVTRNKPDVCGASGVSVTGAGGFPSTFHGTSAAAPHIAAIAALLWAKAPKMTNTQVKNLILNNAADLGAAGIDNIFGSGRADAYNSYMAEGSMLKFVTGVSLDKTQINLKVGETSNLTATIAPTDASNNNVTWSTGNPSVASVDSNGKITGVGSGATTIMVTTSDGGFAASCSVIVTSEVNRYGGANRFETAVQVSQAGWTSSQNVVLVNAYGFADALTGVPLAYEKDAPILLVDTNSIPKATSDEIARLGAKNIYILGGTGVVSQAIEDGLSKQFNVYRISGADRFETGINIGKEVIKSNNSKTAVVTTAFNYPDALSVSSYAAMNQYPILYTETNSLDAKTKDFIKNNGITKIIIPGGTGAVSENVANELRSSGITVERVSGSDRYETGLNIVNQYSSSFKNDVILATGDDFPDALAGGVLAAKKQVPILLVGSNSVTTGVKNYIKSKGEINMYILGGTGAVSDNVINIIRQ